MGASGVSVDVSVIVPTRNRSALLLQALRSALRQRDVDVEVIVVDEGSTDDTPRALEMVDDPRLRVIRHDVPVGVARARNSAAEAATGEWLAFLDDDDLWAPDKLAEQLTAARSAGADWVFSGGVVINENGAILRAQRPPDPDTTVRVVRQYNPIPGGASNVIVRREAWSQVGAFDARLRNTEDWEFYIRLARHAPPACVQAPAVARRLHGNNSTLDIDEIMRGIRLIQQTHGGTPDWAVLHRWLAFSCLRAGRFWKGVGQFARAGWHGDKNVGADLAWLVRARLGYKVKQTPAAERDPWLAAASTWLADALVPVRVGERI